SSCPGHNLVRLYRRQWQKPLAYGHSPPHSPIRASPSGSSPNRQVQRVSVLMPPVTWSVSRGVNSRAPLRPSTLLSVFMPVLLSLTHTSPLPVTIFALASPFECAKKDIINRHLSLLSFSQRAWRLCRGRRRGQGPHPRQS